jgi:hypothetical protein
VKAVVAVEAEKFEEVVQAVLADVKRWLQVQIVGLRMG